jgi:hypothetical protein
MKRYYIVLFIVGCIFIASVHYKRGFTTYLEQFPINKIPKNDRENVVYLLLFFSIKDCDSCLRIIGILNELNDAYRVVGLVPDDELQLIARIRSATDARFEIIGRNVFRKYLPKYSPSLYAIDRRGVIFFVLPGVPGEERYFLQFFESFVHRANGLLTK